MAEIKTDEIIRVENFSLEEKTDYLAFEEPLEIRLNFLDSNKREVEKTLSITMRTPGEDFDLVIGFLFSEGLLNHSSEIREIKHCGDKKNIVRVFFRAGYSPKLSDLQRHFYTSSSCGVCGKTSIEALKTVNHYTGSDLKHFKVPLELLYSLPEKLKNYQKNFKETGGIHGCALFDNKGELILAREDVGRHNALDKLLGSMVRNNESLPLEERILLLSGRASFELIQKASMAGISLIVALGAPSSLAVELAKESGITLIGFLKAKSMNIYSMRERVDG